MSQTYRPKPVYMTICDLCRGEVVATSNPDIAGSLGHGYGVYVTSSTKRAFLHWPVGSWLRRASWEEKRKPENLERRYDFHVACIVKLVEANLGSMAERRVDEEES